MTTIGTFTRDGENYIGTIHTLALNVTATIQPKAKKERKRARLPHLLPRRRNRRGLGEDQRSEQTVSLHQVGRSELRAAHPGPPHHNR